MARKSLIELLLWLDFEKRGKKDVLIRKSGIHAGKKLLRGDHFVLLPLSFCGNITRISSFAAYCTQEEVLFCCCIW